MFGQGALVWWELLVHRAVLGMPQQAAMHGLALVLVGKWAGTKHRHYHIIPVLPFQTSSTRQAFPCRSPARHPRTMEKVRRTITSPEMECSAVEITLPMVAVPRNQRHLLSTTPKPKTPSLNSLVTAASFLEWGTG